MIQVWKGKNIYLFNLSSIIYHLPVPPYFHLLFVIKRVAYCTIVLYLTLSFNNMYMMKNQLWFFCLFFVSNEYVSPICFFFPLFWFSWFLLIVSYSYFHHIYKYLAIVSSNFFSHILSFLSFWDFNYVQIKCLVLFQVSDTVIFFTLLFWFGY